jgi:hypothetical protein
MTNKYVLEELMKIPSTDTTSLFSSLNILRQYGDVILTQNENFDTIYQMSMDDLLSHDIDDDTLLKIRNGGWEISQNGNFLIKNLNN